MYTTNVVSHNHGHPILHRNQGVLSSSIELRRDGLPYANRPEPDDPGVAVYFMYDGELRVFCCDQCDRVQDNIHAIGNTIHAIRGMDRWGVSDMLPRIFRGFQALPDVGGTTGNAWWDILDCRPHAGSDEILRAYREKVKQVHPDVPGGSDEQFHRVQAAFQQARETVKP